MDDSKLQEILLACVRSASAKAKELGYDPLAMQVTFHKATPDICEVYFAPIPPPGKVILGGDLTVRVLLGSAKVRDFERGQ